MFVNNLTHFITVTSHERLESPATRLFVQNLVQANHMLALWEGNSPVTGTFPSQRISNSEVFPYHDLITWQPILLLRADTGVFTSTQYAYAHEPLPDGTSMNFTTSTARRYMSVKIKYWDHWCWINCLLCPKLSLSDTDYWGWFYWPRSQKAVTDGPTLARCAALDPWQVLTDLSL